MLIRVIGGYGIRTRITGLWCVIHWGAWPKQGSTTLRPCHCNVADNGLSGIESWIRNIYLLTTAINNKRETTRKVGR
jgi:hypothetical protein